MPTLCMSRPPTILALGSPHGDDQAAWLVAERLQQRTDFRDCCRRLASPWDIVPHVQEGDALIVIDACRSGAAPGTIHRVTARDLHCLPGVAASSHGGSLTEAFALCESLGYDLAHVAVYALELASAEAGMPVSEALEHGIQRLAEQIELDWSGGHCGK